MRFRGDGGVLSPHVRAVEAQAMLILDFDGTLTDAEAEGAPFKVGYLQDLATLTGATLDEIKAMAAGFEEEMLADKDRYGWIFLGHIVAPASVDPYLRIMPVARKILDHYGAFMGEADRSRLLDGILYKYNYQKSAVAFQPGAREFLCGLDRRTSWVVTNSATDPVRDKVRALSAQGDPTELDWMVERVHGFGKKYVIDPDFDLVPEVMTLPGLSRPVLLRRKKYHDLLDGLRTSIDAAWSDVTVVGDIFELDLALPFHMGATVGLMVNEFTPDYEKAFLDEHPRGVLLHSMEEAAAFVRG
jgi:hypothetical protein